MTRTTGASALQWTHQKRGPLTLLASKDYAV